MADLRRNIAARYVEIIVMLRERNFDEDC